VLAGRACVALISVERAHFLNFVDRGGDIVHYTRHKVGRGTQFFAVRRFLHFN
jgi:hypothetical protein